MLVERRTAHTCERCADGPSWSLRRCRVCAREYCPHRAHTASGRDYCGRGCADFERFCDEDACESDDLG